MVAVNVASKQAHIESVTQELEEARLLLRSAKEGGSGPEIAAAEGLIIEALKAYHKVVPSAPSPDAPVKSVKAEPVVVVAAPKFVPPATEQEVLTKIRAEEGRKKVDDPSRLSGTELRRKAKAQLAAAAAEVQSKVTVKERQEEANLAAKDAELGAYLEPKLRELLADQVLRGEALKTTRNWLTWLREADQNCANAQPVLARRFIGLVMGDLLVQERALMEAQQERPSVAPKARTPKKA